MATVSAHTGIMTSPKFVPLTDGAFRLWWHGLLWSKEHLTDGFIPSGMLASLHRHAAKFVPELLKVHVPGKGPLWHRDVDGYRIHDYADWQESADVVQTRRRRWRDAKQRGSPKVPLRAKSTKDSTVESTQESTSESLKDSAVESRDGSGGGGGSGSGGGSGGGNTQTARATAAPPPAAAVVAANPPKPHIAWKAQRECLDVPQVLYAELLSGMATPDEHALHVWLTATECEWDGRPIGDSTWTFWRARFREWQGTTVRNSPAPRAPQAGLMEAWRRRAAAQD